MTVEVLVRVLLAYLVGSILGSLVLGRLKGLDLRRVGSGNAGATNAFRASGKLFGAGVLAIDLGKGYLAAGLLPMLELPGLGAPPATALAAVLCGAAAMVGHVYPVFFGFQGGKGAATLIGVVAAVAPMALIPMLAVWALGLTLTGYMGASTIAATGAAAIYVILARPDGIADPVAGFAIAMTAFIVLTHRSNIQRLLQGREHRIESVMLLRPQRR